MPANVVPIAEPEPEVTPKVRPFLVPAHRLAEADCRLDASFHSDDAVSARRTIEDSGFEVKLLGDSLVTAQLFWPSRFKRIYTNDPDEGYPFLQASKTLMFRPPMEKWLARPYAPTPVDYFVRHGWILITRSGTVGRCVWVSRRLSQFFLSEDLIRVASVVPSGYLYTFLNTWMGQVLMTREQYGGTISHLEPSHLEGLPVPLLPDDVQRAIHDQITKAYALRDRANNLLDRADVMLHKRLGLTPFNESRIANVGSIIKPKAFAVRASYFGGRLDASYHLPIAEAAVEQMRSGRYRLVQLGDMVERAFVAPRFARIYVDREYGTPLFQSSHVPLMRPHGLKYISVTATRNIENWIVHPGWVFVTCSGTIGRVAVSTSRQDGWAASQHILRIVPERDKSHPGFIAAFLTAPYGYHQVTAKTYGAVVDELTAEDVERVLVPDTPYNVQQEIGELVVCAFEMRDEASELEDQAVAELERHIMAGRNQGGSQNRRSIV